jgi:hypothetical protein
MERVQFIEHKGKSILHLDFSGCTAAEVLTVIEQSKAVIATQHHGSLLTLTDVTNASFNNQVSESMKKFVQHNKPYVAAAAVVGVTGLKQIILNAVMRFSRRHLHAFDSMDRAKDWLAGQ